MCRARGTCLCRSHDSRVLPGKRNQRPTALEALALKVPSEGPRVDVVAIAPWEVPNWVKHVSLMGVENPFIRKTWIHDLTEAAMGMSTMLIHLAAVTRNREAEGLGVVGGAAATYSRGGADITSHDWVIGTELTQFNADAYVLARCHGSAETPLGTHAGRKALGLQDARAAIRT
jgi:hypothetical protein